MNDYLLTVGIETHVQLKTKSKLFSGADNNAIDAEPNTLVNHIDFGLPGALPVLNKQAIELASRAGFALNSKPQAFSKFDRKHYFYPDLPMGYQISQYDQPIILGGYVEFWLDGQLKRVNLTRAHLEADAGKSTHPSNTDYSLVDLNRAGTPLLEIVSEPEMHSAAEAKAYARELYLVVRYADVSDANLFYGNMRFDVNVSVSKDDSLGTRTETKNLNSFRSVERAINYEMKRQIELLESGEQIVQETRGWNDTKNVGFSMRSKENADDYRYMPDPDLPPVELDDQYLSRIEASMPKPPNTWRSDLAKHQLDNSIVESLIEGQVDYDLGNLEYLLSLDSEAAKVVANWIVNIELVYRSRLIDDQQQSITLTSSDIQEIYNQVYKLFKDAKLSSTSLKDLINRLLTLGELPSNIEDYASHEGLIQDSNEDNLGQIIDKVLSDNPKAAVDVKNGEDKVIGFLVGQVMKASKGQANPELAAKLIVGKIKS
jgi:aspartyl-tRNA(Asn)/glutamyl-tRNA(Gln) amidotransferase subunit B